jgi:hypothetical protein
LRHQPARAPGNAEQHDQEKDGRSGSDTKLPAPFVHAKTGQPDQIVAEICNQDSDDDVDLKAADQQSSPAGGSDLSDVNRPQDRGAANAKAADEAEDQQRWPTPREGATDRRNDVTAGENPEALAATEAIAQDAREHGSDDRPQ